MTARDALELTGGRWEQRPGGLRVWVEEEAAPDEVAEMLLGVLQRIADTPARLAGWTCHDCGCGLRTEHELCPNCALAWCRQQEARASWVAFERDNRRTMRSAA